MPGDPESEPRVLRGHFEPTIGIKIVELEDGLAKVTYDPDNPVEKEMINEAVRVAHEDQIRPIFDVEIPLEQAIMAASVINIHFFERFGYFLEPRDDE